MNIHIFSDEDQYNDQIDELIKEAFNQDDEAELVKLIKEKSDFYLSYVAIDSDNDNKVVGHVMVSPILLNDEEIILSLLPVSVLNDYQNAGVGSKLIGKAIKDAKEINQDYPVMCVLGSDHYYKRFGFESYDPHKFTLPFEIEPRFFQFLELKPDSLNDLSGKIEYPKFYSE